MSLWNRLNFQITFGPKKKRNLLEFQSILRSKSIPNNSVSIALLLILTFTHRQTLSKMGMKVKAEEICPLWAICGNNNKNQLLSFHILNPKWFQRGFVIFDVCIEDLNSYYTPNDN